MGAIIGAGVAMGWDDAELDWRIRKAFVESSPVDDLSLPLIAMSRGDKVRERLAEHFGDRQICDLWLPFFCGVTNLTTGAYQIDRRGLLREVLRASVSLPGVLPPVTVGADVLVDGAVLNNFPADVMRSYQDGPIIGVDVGRGRSIEARDVVVPSSLFSNWFVSWRQSGAQRGRRSHLPADAFGDNPAGGGCGHRAPGHRRPCAAGSRRHRDTRLESLRSRRCRRLPGGQPGAEHAHSAGDRPRGAGNRASPPAAARKTPDASMFGKKPVTHGPAP